MSESAAPLNRAVTPLVPVPDGSPSTHVAGAVLEQVTALMEGAPHDQAQEDALTVLEALVTHAASAIGNADWSSVTVIRMGTAATLASSHPEALHADGIQYRLKSGPCVDAALDDNVYATGDIRRDERWPEYGRRVHAEVGVNSVLAYRLLLLGDDSAEAALNIYSRAEHAFDEEDIHQGMLLATQCALLVSAHLANDRAENLLQALGSNREIGVAMGVLMTRHKITQEEAFKLLRIASQDWNRKLADIAREVAETGELPMHRRRRPQR